MRTAARLALAAAVLVSAAPAAAAPPGPGVLCGFVSTTVPGQPVNQQIGVLVGGPVTAATGGTLECSVQVGSAYPAATDVAFVSATGGDVLVVQPTPFAYDHQFAAVYTCTSYVDASGVRWYWNSGWSVSEWTPCVLADYQDNRAHDLWELLRPALCLVVGDICAPPLPGNDRIVGRPMVG